VSLQVKRGSVHAVIGPNGSGKTTLINIISGFLRPNYGKVVFAGQSLVELPGHEIAKKGITRTFQNLSLLEDQTVMENVLLGLHSWWRGSLVQGLLGTRRARATESEKEAFCYGFLDRLGIEPLAFKKVSELSYGQRKLVEMCRALVSQPRLLLLDEPTSGLSQAEIDEFIDLLRKVKEMKVTMILVEHHIDIVESISDWVTVLDEGLVIAQGTYKEIAQDPKVVQAYLGETVAA
jgi:branched-chain amino acid transport system permease protein